MGSEDIPGVRAARAMINIIDTPTPEKSRKLKAIYYATYRPIVTILHATTLNVTRMRKGWGRNLSVVAINDNG